LPTIFNQNLSNSSNLNKKNNNYNNNLDVNNTHILASSAPNINRLDLDQKLFVDKNHQNFDSHSCIMIQNTVINNNEGDLGGGGGGVLLKDQVHVYFKRWLILFVFCFVSLLNAFNWIEYSIIQDVMLVFYNESLPSDEAAQYDAVNWLSMIYMLAYIPLVFPAMFLLERKGLRLSCILGAFLTTLGACVKIAAVRSDLFAVAMLGQAFCAIAQSFTLGVPARLSALWFGPDQIGLATSVIKYFD
jgi:hypothetical protein